jgi:hypothetical protein
MFFLATPLLVLFFYAYRYLSAARRMRRGGQTFVYQIWDGLMLMGKPATVRGLTILGVFCIVAPIAILGWFSREPAANLLASVRSPCKSLLTRDDAEALLGGPAVLEHGFYSRYSCSARWKAQGSDTGVTLDVTAMPTHDARSFRSDRERHGATVKDVAFGEHGLLATAGSGPATDKEEARATQDFERTLRAPAPRPRSGRGNTSPMDSWLDSLPFRGTELWTTVPCDGSRAGSGVSVSLHVDGDASARLPGVQSRMASRIDAVCRLSLR